MRTIVACAPGGSPLTSPTPPEDPEVAAENAALVPAAEGATGYPLTLASPYGETVLTERPERIAVVGGDGDLDAVLALGVAPVIAPDDTDAPWYDGTRADEVPGYFDPDDDFSVSRLVASEPDLIVASSMPGLEEHYADLARVAPVVAAGESGAVAVDWRDLTRAVGAAIDAPGAASTAVESADAAIALPDAPTSTTDYSASGEVGNVIELYWILALVLLALIAVELTRATMLVTRLRTLTRPQTEVRDD